MQPRACPGVVCLVEARCMDLRSRCRRAWRSRPLLARRVERSTRRRGVHPAEPGSGRRVGNDRYVTLTPPHRHREAARQAAVAISPSRTRSTAAMGDRFAGRARLAMTGWK